MTALFEPIYLYCERTGAGFFSEPVSLLSNAVNFLFAWLLWWNQSKRQSNHDTICVVLIVFLVLMGMSGIAFAITPAALSLYAVFEMSGLFLLLSLYIGMHRLLGLEQMRTLMVLLGITFISAVIGHFSDSSRINPMIGYLPFVCALAATTLRLYQRQHTAATAYLKVASLLTASIFLDAGNMTLCPAWPLAAHFLAPICNGLASYLLARTLKTRPTALAA